MNHLPASSSCLSDERERERLSEREGGRQGQEIWLIWISQTPCLLTEKSPLDFSRGFSVHRWGSHLFPTFCLRGSFTASTSITFSQERTGTTNSYSLICKNEWKIQEQLTLHRSVLGREGMTLQFMWGLWLQVQQPAVLDLGDDRQQDMGTGLCEFLGERVLSPFQGWFVHTNNGR